MSETSTPLERYQRSMRRSRTVYYAVLGAVVVALAAVFAVVLARGEAAHVTLHTASHPPATLALAPAAAGQTRAWSTTDRSAVGEPQWHGTVITYSTHTVRGRNARTGTRTWSYNRSDRTVCTAAQVGGTTVAVYRRDGSCDEVTALASDTGARKWTRTLDENGMPVDGTPTLQFSTNTMLVSTPSAVYAIDPGSGIDRWTYNRVGCRIDKAVLGTSGVLISQNCSAQVVCDKAKFCGKGPQLLLRDPFLAKPTDASAPNQDQILWNDIGDTAVPVSADTVVTATEPGTNVLDSIDAKTGRVSETVHLSPAPAHPVTGAAGSVATSATDSTQLIWSGGRVYALTTGATATSWTAAARTAPTVTDSAGDEVPELMTSRITVTTATGVATLDPGTGAVRASYPLPVTSSTTARPLGSGFLLSSPAGTAAYR